MLLFGKSKKQLKKRGQNMIEKYSVRTDLALEEKERFESDNVEIA